MESDKDIEYFENVELAKIRCPTCNNPINWVKPVGNFNDGAITLLASCWSGKTGKGAKGHLFVIKLRNLPRIEIPTEKAGVNNEIQ